MTKLMSVDLMECIQEFENIYNQNEKDFTKIYTYEQYIQLIRSEFIPQVEPEINRFYEFFSKFHSENFDYESFKTEIVHSFQTLLPKYKLLKSIVVNQDCETTQEEILSFLYNFISDLKFVSSIYVPSNVVLSREVTIELSKSKFNSYKKKYKTLIRSIDGLEARKKLKSIKPTFLEPTKQKTLKIGRKTLFLILFAPVLLTVLFHSSEIFVYIINVIETLLPFKILVSILDIPKLLFLYLLNTIETLNSFMFAHQSIFKISIWFLSILWIPSLFLRKSPISLSYSKELILLIISASIYVLFIYKPFMKGLLLALGLFLYPLICLLSLDSSKIERANSDSRKVMFYPMLLALLFSFLITLEPLWLIGVTIWVCFIIVAKISYRYFVPTFNSLSKKDTERDDEIVMDPWILISLLFSCLLLGTGILGELEDTFLSGLYLDSIQIALILIGFLLAAQGVVNSASLKSETEKGKLFEAQSLLRILEGFTGFMITFLTLFIVSIIGYFSTTKFTTFSISSKYITSTINFSSFSKPEFAAILIFSFFITLFILSIFHLFYLFLSGNLILNPLKTTIMYSPLLIESTTNMTKLNPLIKTIEESQIEVSQTEEKQIEKDTINKLKNDRKLNGKVMTSFSINKFSEDLGYYIGCEFEVLTPNKIDLMELSVNLGTNLILYGRFSRISVIVRSKEGSLEMIKVFQVELTEEKLKFVTQNNNLDLEYKFEQVGAFFWNPAFKESHAF